MKGKRVEGDMAGRSNDRRSNVEGHMKGQMVEDHM